MNEIQLKIFMYKKLVCHLDFNRIPIMIKVKFSIRQFTANYYKKKIIMTKIYYRAEFDN